LCLEPPIRWGITLLSICSVLKLIYTWCDYLSNGSSGTKFLELLYFSSPTTFIQTSPLPFCHLSVLKLILSNGSNLLFFPYCMHCHCCQLMHTIFHQILSTGSHNIYFCLVPLSFRFGGSLPLELNFF
jgi:hypothetical protein